MLSSLHKDSSNNDRTKFKLKQKVEVMNFGVTTLLEGLMKKNNATYLKHLENMQKRISFHQNNFSW